MTCTANRCHKLQGEDPQQDVPLDMKKKKGLACLFLKNCSFIKTGKSCHRVHESEQDCSGKAHLACTYTPHELESFKNHQEPWGSCTGP